MPKMKDSVMLFFTSFDGEEEKPESILEGLTVLQNAQKLIGPLRMRSQCEAMRSHAKPWLTRFPFALSLFLPPNWLGQVQRP